jgi:MraZ protein
VGVSGKKCLKVAIFENRKTKIIVTTFLGEYQCSVDVKSRIMLPSALKRQMNPAAQDRLAVRKDTFSSCLALFPWD